MLDSFRSLECLVLRFDMQTFIEWLRLIYINKIDHAILIAPQIQVNYIFTISVLFFQRLSVSRVTI